MIGCNASGLCVAVSNYIVLILFFSHSVNVVDHCYSVEKKESIVEAVIWLANHGPIYNSILYLVSSIEMSAVGDYVPL